MYANHNGEQDDKYDRVNQIKSVDSWRQGFTPKAQQQASRIGPSRPQMGSVFPPPMFPTVQHLPQNSQQDGRSYGQYQQHGPPNGHHRVSQNHQQPIRSAFSVAQIDLKNGRQDSHAQSTPHQHAVGSSEYDARRMPAPSATPAFSNTRQTTMTFGEELRIPRTIFGDQYEVIETGNRHRNKDDMALTCLPPKSTSGSSKLSRAQTLVTHNPGNAPARHSAYTLVDAIKRGEYEDQAASEKLERTYSLPPKMTQPLLGPSRSKDGSTFNPKSNDLPSFARAPSQLIRSGLATYPQLPHPLWLGPAQQGLCVPELGEVCDDLPITELGGLVAPSTAGVLKFTDIPFATCRAEIVGFIGRHAHVICLPEPSQYHAVHILMERETGKTNDCFVEVANSAEAASVVRFYQSRAEQGHPPKLGDRAVKIHYSSQDELLSKLFPRAKHVEWKKGRPIVDFSRRSYYPGSTAVGFRGFINPEELIMIDQLGLPKQRDKHGNLKERSPFLEKSPTRVYETMITIMHKYPWYALSLITVRERDMIYNCVIKLMGTLVEEIRQLKGKLWTPLAPSPALLEEMAMVALVCPGFTERQKYKLIGYLRQDGYGWMVTGVVGSRLNLGGNHQLGGFWPFVSLSVLPGADIELVKYYGRLFYEATLPSPNAAAHPMGDVNVTYKGSDDLSDLTLAKVAKLEYEKINELLAKAVKLLSNRFDQDRIGTYTPAPLHNPYAQAQAITGSHAGNRNGMLAIEGPTQHGASARGSNERAPQGYSLAQAIARPRGDRDYDMPAIQAPPQRSASVRDNNGSGPQGYSLAQALARPRGGRDYDMPAGGGPVQRNGSVRGNNGGIGSSAPTSADSTSSTFYDPVSKHLKSRFEF